MKKSILLIVFACLFTLNFAMAQGKGKKVGNQTVSIKTSAQCDMCKERIEKALATQKGIKSAKLDVDTQTATVVYNGNQTTPDKIREAITAVGYDADDKKANTLAYKKLPGCCKK